MAITIKLNDTNYLVWSQSVLVFITSQSNDPHLFGDPPAKTSLDWIA